MTARQYLKLHPEKYVMVTHEFGQPIYIAPCENLRTQVTANKDEAEQWTSLDYNNPNKLDYAKLATGYNGLQFKLINN